MRIGERLVSLTQKQSKGFCRRPNFVRTGHATLIMLALEDHTARHVIPSLELVPH
jgi:hypothetical protein